MAEPAKSVADLEAWFVLRGYAEQLRYQLQNNCCEHGLAKVAGHAARMSEIISARAAR